MKLSETDRRTFAEQGIIALRGFLPRRMTELAKKAILDELTRLKLRTGGKLNSSKFEQLPIFQQSGYLEQKVGSLNEVDGLFTDELLEIIGSLAGTAFKSSSVHSQILLSFPHKIEWSLNSLNWHLDLKVPMTDNLPGVQAFILIDDLEPKGGATLALAGSHKLHYVSKSGNAHEILKKSEEFQTSPGKFLEPQTMEGIKIKIIEMTGRAGDIYLMDLRVLHSPSINAGKKIRMMATSRYII